MRHTATNRFDAGMLFSPGVSQANAKEIRELAPRIQCETQVSGGQSNHISLGGLEIPDARVSGTQIRPAAAGSLLSSVILELSFTKREIHCESLQVPSALRGSIVLLARAG